MRVSGCVWAGMVAEFRHACVHFEVAHMHGGTRRRPASRRVKGTAGYEAIFKLLKAIKRKFLNTCPNRLFPSFLPSFLPISPPLCVSTHSLSSPSQKRHLLRVI